MAKPKKKTAKKPSSPRVAKPLPPIPPALDPRQFENPVPSMRQEQEQPAAVDSVSEVDSAAPGRDELERLASQTDQPAPGSESSQQPRVPVFVVTEEHRHVTAFLTDKLAMGVEGVLPIRYGQDTRDTVTGALAPVVAKHYDKFPLWFLLWKEEITAGMVISKVVFDTWKEVRRVNQIEADIEELASKYRAEGSNRKVARERAMQELGYTVGPQPAAAAA